MAPETAAMILMTDEVLLESFQAVLNPDTPLVVGWELSRTQTRELIQNEIIRRATKRIQPASPYGTRATPC